MNKDFNIVKFFSFKRVLLPVMLGVGVAFFLIFRNTDIDILKEINWTYNSYFWLFMAFVMVVLRDLGYIIRLRLLTLKALSWKKNFQVIMLWEFASALTPSIVGGSAVAMFIIHKEKISLGRATAVVMITALLDELFYLIVTPIVLLLVFKDIPLFSTYSITILGVNFSTLTLFIFGYGFMLFLTLFISYAIFINPRGIKAFLVKFFKFRFIRRWRYGALITGNDLITTSKEMKGMSLWFWIKAFATTFLSWTARFFMVNFLILVFLPVDNHLHIYATQLVMWVIMLVSPTPGGSGIAEFIFNDFLSPFLIVGLAPILALIWRILSYYIYLIVGSIVLPIWINRVLKKKKSSE